MPEPKNRSDLRNRTFFWGQPVVLGVDSPLFSTIVLSKNLLFPLGFWWLCEKKDAWKEWKWKCPLEKLKLGFTQKSIKTEQKRRESPNTLSKNTWDIVTSEDLYPRTGTCSVKAPGRCCPLAPFQTNPKRGSAILWVAPFVELNEGKPQAQLAIWAIIWGVGGSRQNDTQNGTSKKRTRIRVARLPRNTDTNFVANMLPYI